MSRKVMACVAITAVMILTLSACNNRQEQKESTQEQAGSLAESLGSSTESEIESIEESETETSENIEQTQKYWIQTYDFSSAAAREFTLEPEYSLPSSGEEVVWPVESIYDITALTPEWVTLNSSDTFESVEEAVKSYGSVRKTDASVDLTSPDFDTVYKAPTGGYYTLDLLNFADTEISGEEAVSSNWWMLEISNVTSALKECTDITDIKEGTPYSDVISQLSLVADSLGTPQYVGWQVGDYDKYMEILTSDDTNSTVAYNLIYIDEQYVTIYRNYEYYAGKADSCGELYIMPVETWEMFSQNWELIELGEFLEQTR